MRLLETFRVALRALATHKLRSSLTVLGIVIGVGAVICLVSLGRGVQASITSQIESMGSNVLHVRPGTPMEVMFGEDPISTGALTLEDAQAIANEAPSVAMVTPMLSIYTQVIFGSEDTKCFVVGTTSEYQELRNLPMAEGVFISRQDVDANRNVVVLGSSLKEALFDEASPLGELIKIGRYKYKVVGVLESVGAAVMMSEDEMVIAPITTVQSRLATGRTTQGERIIDELMVRVVDEGQMEAAEEQITDILRERHRIAEGEDNDFGIMSMEQLQSMVGQITGMLTLFLGAIASISLLVGGVGIMNIMLVSVRERTREIGIRKAVGAKRRDILRQFLLEAALLSLMGGMVGLVVGWGLSVAFSWLLSSQGMPIQAVIAPDIVVVAISVSAAIGLFFGIYPAARAARLNPIDALRYE